MEDAGSGGWNGEPAWTGRTSGRDPQGSVPFQTRPSDRPFSSPVALPESYVLPVPWRAPPSPRFNHALQLLRPSSWLGRCRRLRSSSSPDRGEHCRMRDCSRRRRRAAAPHRAPTARPRRTSSLRAAAPRFDYQMRRSMLRQITDRTETCTPCLLFHQGKYTWAYARLANQGAAQLSVDEPLLRGTSLFSFLFFSFSDQLNANCKPSSWSRRRGSITSSLIKKTRI
jgi:hypothetical protein